MSVQITEKEFLLFREFIERHCGIHLGMDKMYLVEHRLANILEQNNCSSYGDLFNMIRGELVCGRLCSSIIDAITTNETSWFRDPKQFQALSEYIWPELWTKIRQGRRTNLNIWSAACSTGQEPYSIAMTVADFCQKQLRDDHARRFFQVLATDISETALTAAQMARYDSAAIARGLDDYQIAKFFHQDGRAWLLKGDLKSNVTFKQFNLRHAMTSLGLFDVIFLRNVVIYFSDKFKKELFERIADRLLPGGWLFLGTGETIVGPTSHFEIEERSGANFYRLKC